MTAWLPWRRRARRLAAAALAAGLLVGVAVALSSRHGSSVAPREGGSALVPSGEWRPVVPTGRVLVANERDTGTDASAARSPDWFVTSGSWFADAGAWWSGRPDGGSPDLRSETATGSAVLRVVSALQFVDCRVEFDLRVEGMASTARTPPQAYDGVHVFVRYRDASTLYAVSVVRRDGLVVVKKKLAGAVGAGADDEGYTTLATGQGRIVDGSTAHVVVTARDVADGVRLRLTVDDEVLLDVVDRSRVGVPALVGEGRVGLRGDNTEFRVWNFHVTVPEPRAS